MKKLTALLLIIALLTAGLSGCGNKKEVEFGAKIHHFIGLTIDNASAIHDICYVESECLREDQIGAEEMDREYYDKCLAKYKEQVEIWRREGEDVSDLDLATILKRCDQIDKEYQEIMAINIKAENIDELKDAATRIYEAHQKLLGLQATIYGPAEDFTNEYSGYFSDASSAHSDAVELLEPYYQKPGFVQLINK